MNAGQDNMEIDESHG